MQTPFESLPIQKDGPKLNAWGLFGKEDELGRLNLITPESVQRGAKEVQHGLVINLNLPLNMPQLNPDRVLVQHHILHKVRANDDHLAINTQSSTQWDGFRHYPYHNWPEKGINTFYNGQSADDARSRAVTRNGTQNFVKHPITSRAHLLDIESYIKKHNLPPLDHFTGSGYPISYLKDCAKECNIEFHPGDILCVRMGYTEALFGLKKEDQMNLSTRKGRPASGLEPSEELFKWHWDNGIAAVVTDGVAYEKIPFPASGPALHEIFLAGWGMPIGELFDLRELAKECERLKKWTFFFTSMPLYVEGGIASPPNAQAIL